ncbi:UV radiation resistance protein and autophagy-related subunit 14-domain-containing protein [Rhexocercosporidium sp. MPI-PUGE-AT-0058]|nr:UV radiation resistance protein and autophagy-related subunit 14-domain-containing protein [Rhexocercosporidium sp. MPI-PUGE-AT-0058]
MQCDICFRAGGQGDKKLHFLCPTDARNQLYDGRIQNARVLLENDSLNAQITNLFPGDKAQQNGELSHTSKNSIDISMKSVEREQAIDRTHQIITQADELRAKVELAKEEIAKRKATVARRKSDLASASNGVDARRIRQVEEVKKATGMTKHKWNLGHATTASSRTFLCGEAAKLYGLKKGRRNSGSEEYRIGGVRIVDLRSLNTASPAEISTALSHIVHLLMLSTHYLAIRLPAEITLPHRDYPLPTIFPIASSYKHTDVPFPGSTPNQSSNTSPTASRHAEAPSNLPHPRPLFITKPLPLFSAEDPSGYGLFLEGVTLLAYDVAWVCKSQGIPVGDESSFEDICNLGRNLYNLLIGTRPRPSPGSRASSAQSTPTKGGRDTDVESERRNPQFTTMGIFSHGTAHSFLGGAVGTEFIRSWKLLSPTKLADKLKAKLLSEVANAEWEMLDADAWAVDDVMGDDGVVVGARKEATERQRDLGMQSFMSMRTVVDAVEMVGGEGERKPGTSGWTKLRK